MKSVFIITYFTFRRAALEKWKQKLGSDATYSNLISVFEHAGYQGYAEVVRYVCGEYNNITPPQCLVKG